MSNENKPYEDILWDQIGERDKEYARLLDQYHELRERADRMEKALEPVVKQIESMLKTPIDVRSGETLEQYHARDPMPGRHGLFLTFNEMLAVRAAATGADGKRL